MLYTEMVADHRNKCGDLDGPNNNVKIINDRSDLTLLCTEQSLLLDIWIAKLCWFKRKAFDNQDAITSFIDHSVII